jgi:transposase InsO family protein
MNVAPELQGMVLECETAADAMKKLQDNFDPSKTPAQYSLLHDLFHIELRSEDLTNYFFRIDDLVLKVSARDFQLPDRVINYITLSGLPEEFSIIKTILWTSKDLTTKSDVRRALLQFEASNVKPKAEQSNMEKALHMRNTKQQSKGRWKPKPQRDPKSGEGNTQHKSASRPKRPPYDPNASCTYCSKTGHSFNNCLIRQRDIKNSKCYNAALVTNDYESSDETTTWYLDSGSTAHMACDKSYFQHLKDVQEQWILLGNNTSIKVQGQGDIKCVTRIKGKPSTFTLYNVLYVPELKKNLISADLLIKDGYSVTLKPKKTEVIHETSKRTLFEVHSHQGMFIVPLSPIALTNLLNMANAFRKTTKTLQELHEDLGHPSIKRTKLAAKSSEDIDICDEKFDQCESCIKAKQSKNPVGKGPAPRSCIPFEIIHSDLCGPMPEVSKGGKKYFLTFTDDYSRYTTIYFLKEKSEVPQKLFEFLKIQGISTKVRTLHCDNGGEFISNKFESQLKELGIKLQRTPTYTPEYNGVAERLNRTILEMIRAMLISSQMSRSFWAEAAFHAVYLKNRLPTSSNQNKSPYEILYNKVPRLGHLKPFGSKVFLYTQKRFRDKLTSKSVEANFIGMVEDTQIYRLWIPTKNIVTTSKDVIFAKPKSNQEQPNSNAEIMITNDSARVSIIEPNDFTNRDNIIVPHQLQQQPLSHINVEPNDEAEESIQTLFQEEYSDNSESSSSDSEIVNDQQIQPRRSSRINKGVPPSRLIESLLLTNTSKTEENEPHDFKSAMESSEKEKWIKAMKLEYESLVNNNTFTLVPLPPNRKPIQAKWIFKVKHDANGVIQKHKARWVVLSFELKCKQILNDLLRS